MNNKLHFDTLKANLNDSDVLEMYLDSKSDEQFLEQMRHHRDNFNKAIAIIDGGNPRDNSTDIHRMLSDMGMFGAIWWSDDDIREEFEGSFEEEVSDGDIPGITDEDIAAIRAVLVSFHESGYTITAEVVQEKVSNYVNDNMRKF